MLLISATRFFVSLTFSFRSEVLSGSASDASPVRVSTVWQPIRAKKSRSRSTIARLTPLSGVPSTETAPPSEPPCPASRIMTSSAGSCE